MGITMAMGDALAITDTTVIAMAETVIVMAESTMTAKSIEMIGVTGAMDFSDTIAMKGQIEIRVGRIIPQAL